ncbi:hypothetical protein BJY24_003551 [Nocardia transvalensis]|uniref:Uncharacterized protein n=1 Tax=Nocardia transvalensis TaxID=37333 RepID=A0A7W9PFK4_9NOCA|nr:hypothetical protein [Nocardia transvalensis]MBB5914684.1 hypothetical protein [Nocardia transvalensis]
MAITPEENLRTAREILGPTLRDERGPEARAKMDQAIAWLREMEESEQPPATEEQQKNWDRWRDSELKRIERNQGNASE